MRPESAKADAGRGMARAYGCVNQPTTMNDIYFGANANARALIFCGRGNIDEVSLG
jgi:hypothetical protein